MRAVSISDFRANIASMFDEIVAQDSRIIVTRSGKRNVVVLSEREWNGIEETLYLLSNPVNARRLAEAILDIDRGKAEPRDLIEPKATAAK